MGCRKIEIGRVNGRRVAAAMIAGAGISEDASKGGTIANLASVKVYRRSVCLDSSGSSCIEL